jgi:hypothetical protein
VAEGVAEALEVDTTSMPAAFTASYALGGARKWNSFGSGAPRVVTAVSRLTIARSAADRVDEIDPNAVAGSPSRSPVRSAKCTSPATGVRRGWHESLAEQPAGDVRLSVVVAEGQSGQVGR